MSKSDWKSEWSEVVVSNITPAMLAWENDFFGFPSEAPLTRWLAFVQAIVQNESANDPLCDYQEDASVDYNVSRGLLQLSVEDAQSYPDLPTVASLTLENIYEPETNLKAGLEIMNCLIERGETSLRSYWSTCNEDDEKGEATKQILAELLGE